MHHWSIWLFFWCCQNTLTLNQTGCHLNATLADHFHSQNFQKQTLGTADERHVTGKGAHRRQWKGCFPTLWQCSRQQIKGIIHQTVISTLAVTNKAPHFPWWTANQNLPDISDSINFLCEWSFSERRICTHNQEWEKKWFALMPEGPKIPLRLVHCDNIQSAVGMIFSYRLGYQMETLPWKVMWKPGLFCE